ncbi:MAG: Mov34/MPN/PAD-1 family protein [Chloroflexi bacterium]|nr:Mov34/MPN/PAD-1 family protein [Chloroflexota bacterium]
MNPVGYLLNTKSGFTGEPGAFCDYILAGNGLFVKAQSPLLEATIMVAPAEIRGLDVLERRILLTHGKIPGHLYDLAMSLFRVDHHHERYAAIVWKNGEYCLEIPRQTVEAGSVEYDPVANAVVDIHSHGVMNAFFSETDNHDEQGLRIYMVVGRLDMLIPDMRIRLGVYGYFTEISLGEVFDSW